LVQVTETGNPPITQVQDVCVDSGTDVYWYTAELNSYFTVVFGLPHPFADIPANVQPTFQGKKGQAVGDTIMVGSGPACYQYSAQHCIGSACTKVDPKVIITSGLVPPGAKKKPK
jgi:hypothetical protein